jgi:hypothetical protein
MNRFLCMISTISVFLLTASGANAALVSRLDGAAYYDTVLDITWLANANAGAGTIYDDGPSSTDGSMSWINAQAWIASLNASNYLGVNDWRLPTVSPIDGDSFDLTFSNNGTTDVGHNISAPGSAFAGSTASELAHLWYNTLNNKNFCDPVLSTADTCVGPQDGWALGVLTPFTGNVSPFRFWTGTDAGGLANAFVFMTDLGLQSFTGKTSPFALAWAVRPGDIGQVVPVPPAVWLLGSALGVIGVLSAAGSLSRQQRAGR